MQTSDAIRMICTAFDLQPADFFFICLTAHSPLRARHVQADFFRRDVLCGSSSPTISPSYMTRMRSDRSMHLVHLQRNQQDAFPGVARGDDLLVDVLNRADVQSARGLHGDRAAAGHWSISRATMAFCWLPPDMLRAMVMGPWPERMSYCSISLDRHRRGYCCAPEEARLVREFRLEIPLEHDDCPPA